jgi:ADP-ribose pyrophosphatase YjhB (NUDIX family)
MGKKPVTPLVGCDVFVLNDKNEVLLIKRRDNGFWATPGGCHDLGETRKQCAERECFEESGYKVKVTDLLGVYSSNCYEYINYPWKENEFAHILFAAEITGGTPTTSNETTQIGWFSENEIPPISDGHEPRIKLGFEWSRNKNDNPHLE